MFFVKTAASNGTKVIPLDVEPNPDGNVTLVWSESRNQREAVVHAKDQLSLFDDDSLLYMPHHATCPNWRKP